MRYHRRIRIALLVTVLGCAPRPATVALAPAPGEPAHLQVVRTHTTPVTELVWSHDGKRLASVASGEAVARVWDAATGCLVRALKEPAIIDLKHAAWLDGDRAILLIGDSLGFQHRARIVELETGVARDVELERNDEAVALLPGDRIVVRRNSELAVVAPDRTRRVLGTARLGQQIVAAADGSVVAAADRQTITAWVDGGTNAIEVGAYIDGVYALPEGRVVAYTRGAAKTFDRSGRLVATRELKDALGFATAGDATAVVHLDDLELAGKPPIPIAALGGQPAALAFDATASHLAVAGQDGTLSIVEVAPARIVQRLGHAPASAMIADFIDDSHVVIATTRGLVTFDLDAAKLTGDLPTGPPLALGAVRGQGFVYAGQRALALRLGQFEAEPCRYSLAPSFGATHVSVWGQRGVTLPAIGIETLGARGVRVRVNREASTWTPPAYTTCVPAMPFQAQFGVLADRRDLATGQLVVVEPAADTPTKLGTIVVGKDDVRWLAPALAVWTLADLSSDGRRILAIGFDDITKSEALVWDAADGKLLQRSPVPPTTIGALSPDGNTAVFAVANQVAVVPADQPVAQPTATLAESVTAISAAVTDRGVAVVVGARGEFVIVRGGEEKLGKAGGAVAQIAIAPGGERAVALVDGAVQIWRLDRAELVATLYLYADGEWIAIAPDGLYHSSFEASRRVAWQFDAPLANVDLERYGARYHAPARLAARLRGDCDAAVPEPTRPPLLAWSTPPHRDGDRVDLAISIRGAARDVLVFADGIPVGTLDVVDRTTRGTLTIPPTARRIVATAYAPDGVASSSLDATVDAVATGREPRLWVVAVGVSTYPGLPRAAQLRFADDDARAIAEALAKPPGFRDVHARLLVDEDATAPAITTALGELAEMAPDDVAVVAFSGHGMIVGDATVMLLSTADLDAPETGALEWRDVSRALAAARGRVLVLLDACHAGAISHDALTPNADVAATLVHGGRAGMVVLAAAKGRETSVEDASGGVFTQAVVAAIGDATRARRDLWIGELVTSVQTRVSTATARQQTPWLVRADVFGDFRLVSGQSPSTAPSRSGRR